MLQFKKRNASEVLNADLGKVIFFANISGSPQYKDENGSVFNFQGPRGVSITQISRSLGNGAAGTTDTYQIFYDNGTSSSFTVTNGANGQGSPATVVPPKIATESSLGTQTTKYALEDHTHGGVLSFNGRSGSISPQQADYDQFFTTPAEAAGAAPVQSVAGKTGTVTLVKADVGLNNVKNPVITSIHTTTAQTLTTTLANIATVTIPANTLIDGDTFEFDVIFSTLVNTTAASNLEVALLINGVSHYNLATALGTTAVAAPGRGGRHFGKLTFRTVGTAGTALGNGTTHINNLANFATNTSTAVTVNTTAAVTLTLQARSSVATTTGVVQFASIEQCP